MKSKSSFYTAIFVLIIIFSLHLKLNILEIFEGLPNLWILMGDSFPPNADVLKVSMIATIETIEIAFIGTILGLLLSFPLAFLASRNLFSKKIVVPIRILLSALRTMPSLLWAVVFVIIIGFGPDAGVLATMMYTVGYLGKLQYETIEGINQDPIEAISSTGANKLQIIKNVIIPESANHLLSQILFMFEYNVRSSTILGFVGAGGIGFYIQSYLKFLEYDKVLTLLIVVFITVLIIDYISVKVRDKYLSENKMVL